jgi:hypothetical protein
MSAIYTLTSNDTLTINGRTIVDLSADDVTTVTFPNELITRKTGKNGNTIFASNAAGANADMTLRLMRGSSDDVFLSKLIPLAGADFPSTKLVSGSFVKRLGDGLGGTRSDVYSLDGGVVSKNVDGKENVAGDASQGEGVYMTRFAAAKRVIG